MAGRKAEATVHVIGQVRLRRRGAKKLWHARYMTPAGRKEQSLKVTNLKVAMRKARDISDLLERGEFTTLETRQASRKMTFATLMEEFKANYTNWSESTWRGNQAMLGKLEDEFGDLPLSPASPPNRSRPTWPASGIRIRLPHPPPIATSPP